MRFTRFTIANYRAITGPLNIDISKHCLMPIIGVNESGKTTLLHAIFAFDYYNDDLNDSGRHLKDVSNLYRTSSPAATVSAEVELSAAELKTCLEDCAKEHPSFKSVFEVIRGRRKLSNKILIRRNIVTKKYTFPSESFGPLDAQDILARKVISYLPYILYFDDFRDKIAEKIEIPSKEDDESLTDWLAIIQQLFKQTDKTFSIFKLPQLEVRQRRTVLSKVQRHLNQTLTKEWQSFRLDDRDALKIAIEFDQDGSNPVRNFLKLDVVETDSNGDEHFFFISDRSKGFYWFFNFVMKLEFNPKLVSSGGNDAHSIYLLDEPGSYLHAFAQRKLCLKLRQISDKNSVIYCTHSHYLLDPETIPISNVVIADKNGNGDITLTRMIDYHGSITDNRSALQPVLDALQIKPYALDLISTQMTLIVEGIYDYYSLELFRGDRSISVLPSVGAGSIKFYISLMIAWQIKFRALWDSDAEGRKKHSEAAELFGSDIATRYFRLLPSPQADGKRIMQNLFEGSDLVQIRKELKIAPDCSFERTIQALFYSPEKIRIVASIGADTKTNFELLFASLSLDA
jgi:hypothetical protein